MIVRTEEDLVAWQRAWANYHVLLSMARLGLFDLLQDGQARSAETLARELHADARAMDVCCRILVRSGLLLYEDSAFRIAPAARELQAPIDELKWEWRRRDNFADLLDTVRSGRPAMVTSGGVVEQDEADARQFLRMLYRRSASGVQEAVKLLRQVWSEVGQESAQGPRILDLGGGHGRYAATFAAEVPGAQVTLFDRELVTRIARELSGDSFTVRSGDFLKDDLGGPYDIVFMAYIVSGIALADVRDLLKRLRQVIVPGGALIVEDMFVDPDNQEPAFAIDFNLTLLLENERGRFRAIPEIVGILAETGFPKPRYVRLSEQDFSFIVGR